MKPLPGFWRWLAGFLACGLALVAPASRPESAPAAKAIRLNNLAVAYMNQQRFEQALKFFEQASELSPQLLPARLNQGIALLNLQRFEPAREILLEITRREPNSVRAWYNLGLLYKNLGQAESGLEAFERTSQLDPSDADIHYFRGLLYTQLQHYDKAITAFERALALNRFHVSAEFGLARAYQRLRDTAQARQHLARFDQLNQQKLGAPMSLAYGDQGHYSLAEQILVVSEAAPPPIRVRFTPVARQAGLKFRNAGGFLLEPYPAVPKRDGQILSPAHGAGACFLDYDGDGRSDLFLLNTGKEATSVLYRNVGEGRFVEKTQAARLEVRGFGMGCAVGDYDNDGWTDLVVSFLGGVGLFRNQGDGTFRNVTKTAGLDADGFFMGLTFLDFDHDGDLDLYLLRFLSFPRIDVLDPTNILWRNNGNGTFTDWTEPTQLGAKTGSVAAAVTDLNNDRAVDIVLTGLGESTRVFLNQREGPFQAVNPWATPLPGFTAGVAVLDFNKDGWMDLVFTHWGEPGISLWRNSKGSHFELVALPAPGWINGWGVAVLDYDNDGWLDLAALGETVDAAEILLLRNPGPQGFEDVTTSTGLSGIKLEQPRGLITADYDGDGDTDLLVTQFGGPVHLLRNDGGNQNAWVRIALRGLADNKSGIGTKLEIFAGALWQKWEVGAASGYLGQNALAITAGLGGAGEVDIVRLVWPTGVLQDEVHIATRRTHSVNEIDRKGSSCPILFVWNGSRYEFITDLIGAGIMGHWVGPGERNVPDPTEYIKVDATRVRPLRGRLSFRFVEPMEEVIYLDQARLLAIDHPAEIDVYPNEYFASMAPFPAFKVIATRDPRPPAGAWDEHGHEVLPELLHRDRHYVSDFGLLPFKGFAELHSLELELGVDPTSRPLRLLLHGFIDYFSATSVFAAYQAEVRPIPPYIEALNAGGRWVRVVENMGFPAGLARTMVADLTGRLSAGTQRIRIVTNLQIYWDQILVDTTPESLPLRISEVPLAEATLAFRGYPRALEGNPRGDLTYIYEEVSQTGPYARHIGSYTRYGDVQALLTDTDDHFVILGSGEEVRLEFEPSSLPLLPAAWTRDYFFLADGFTKDMDFYEAYSHTVEPLPFHNMGSYPYPEARTYPLIEAYLEYRLAYNERFVSGTGFSTYYFEYGLQKKKRE